MTVVFLDLLNMSISASWMILAVLAARLLLKKAPRWAVCGLWALVAIRLIFPFSIESAFSLIPSAQTLPPDILTENRFQISSGVPVIDQQINDVVLDSYYEGVTVPTDNGFNVMSTLTVIWLVGITVLLIYAAVTYLQLWRKVSASICLRENIFLCDYIDSPFILGILFPKIYLPSTLEESQWPHVIAHEKAHLQRRDHWWKPLGFGLLCLHWFNPLMWLAYFLLCKDIELACDEKVIKDLGESQKKAYSEALLECSMPRHLIAACPLAFGEVGVKERVKSVLNYKKPAFWIILIAIIACVITAVCFLTDPVTEPEDATAEFRGTVIESSSGFIIVAPEEGSPEAQSADRICINLPEGTPTITVGETVRIVYDGLIQETYPAQITGASLVQVIMDLEYLPHNYSLEQAILDGCVAMVNGDVVAGEAIWQSFADQAYSGQPASVRFVTYSTVSSPANYNPGDFPDIFSRYPVMIVYDLTFDGEVYTLRSIENGTEYVNTFPYMIHYTGVKLAEYEDYESSEWYILTDMEDMTWQDYRFSVGLSSSSIRSYPVYADLIYTNEPTLVELEMAKTALEPHMREYRIAGLDANELTGRLDVVVYEWVDGLDTLIGQYMDLDFVTITRQKTTLEFTLETNFPEYFELSTVWGLDLYALESGDYVLMAGTDGNRPEEEIAAMTPVSAGEMKLILHSYEIDVGAITIFNHTDLSEYAIRQELGILPPCNVTMEITNATATEALITYNIYNLNENEVWTGYDYWLEVHTDDGWVHYGYPKEELAWDQALLFSLTGKKPTPEPTDFQRDIISMDSVSFVIDWSRTADAPLPPGTYRYCKNITISSSDRTRTHTRYALFVIEEGYPENQELHLEILNPTDTGATLALTYNGGLPGDLSTGGKYYLMADTGNGVSTIYGLIPSQVDWDDVRYPLAEGETVYLDVRWDHTADAPLAPGTYHVVMEIDLYISNYNGFGYTVTQYITESFTVTD